jgi:hypothetical protein
MNARKSKAIRKAVYEKGHHPEPVLYKVDRKTGAIVADDYRKIYQDTKMVNK